MTVSKLIELYEKSPVFNKLSAASRKSYAIHLRKIEHEMGKAPAAKIEPKDVTHLMDKLADQPGTANMCLAVIGTVYKWGRKRHHVPLTCEPTRDVERLELGEHEPWPAPVLNAALASKNARVRLATHLLYYTAQRIGDVVKRALVRYPRRCSPRPAAENAQGSAHPAAHCACGGTRKDPAFVPDDPVRTGRRPGRGSTDPCGAERALRRVRS